MASATGTTFDQGDEAGVSLPIATQVGQTLSPEQTAQNGGAAAAAPIGQTANPEPGVHTYVLGNGATFKSPDPLSESDLEDLAKQTGYHPEQWKDVTNQKSILGNMGAEARRSVMEGVNGLVQGGGAILKGTADKLGDDDDAQSIGDWLDARQNKYNDMMAHQEDLRADTPDYKDVNSVPSAVKFVTGNLASAAPQAAAYAVGGPLAYIASGAAQNVGAISPETRDPLSMALAAGTGALTSSITPPLVGGAKSLTGKLVKGAIGNTIAGGLGGALANVPTAPETGTILPTADQIAEGAIKGLTVGPIMGHVMGGERSPDAPETKEAVDPADPVKGVQQAKDIVGDNLTQQHNAGFDLKDATKAKVAADNVHNDIAEGIKANLADLPQLDPDNATNFEDQQNRAQMQSTIRDSLNKVKGGASESDIQQINDAVGDTQQGKQLVSLLRQSNVLSDLQRNGVRGGVSSVTDLLNPLHALSTGSGMSGLLAKGVGAGELMALYAHPMTAVPAVAGMAAGRGIDALTGNRYPLLKFANANGNAAPIDFGGAPDVRASMIAQQEAQGAINQYRGNQQQVQAQQQADQKAQLAAQAQSDAQNVQSFKNAVKYGGLADVPSDSMMAQQQAPAPQPTNPVTSLKNWASIGGGADNGLGNWAQFSGVRGFKAPRAQGPASALAPKMAAAPTQAEPAINQAEQAERQALREQNDPGHPNSFDGMVHAKTGLKPQEALGAVQKMADDGLIPQAHADAFRDNPRALMAGNVGLRIIDRLAALKGQASAAVPEPAMNPLRKASYDATANGNQAAINNADAHILGRTDLSDSSKKTIRTALSAMRGITNKMSAAAVRDHMMSQLSGHDQAVADSVVSPLVEQIRHATPADSAAHAFQQPVVQQQVKKTANKLAAGDTSDISKSDADMVKMFEQEALSKGKSASDARLYGMLKMIQWVEAGRPMGNGN